jgi:hypothetical protein
VIRDFINFIGDGGVGPIPNPHVFLINLNILLNLIDYSKKIINYKKK